MKFVYEMVEFEKDMRNCVMIFLPTFVVVAILFLNFLSFSHSLQRYSERTHRAHK